MKTHESDERDESLDALRNAWEQLTPPAGDARSNDPGEHASVAWMQAAWRELEAPTSAVPEAALRHVSTNAPRRRRNVTIGFAIAASIGAVALAAWFALDQERATTTHEPTDELVTHTEPEAPEVHEARGEAELFELAAIEPGRMEVRSGSVRLILLDSTETPLEGTDAR